MKTGYSRFDAHHLHNKAVMILWLIYFLLSVVLSSKNIYYFSPLGGPLCLDDMDRSAMHPLHYSKHLSTLVHQSRRNIRSKTEHKNMCDLDLEWIA